MKRLLLAALVAYTPLSMADVTVDVHKVNTQGSGDSIGTVTFKDTQYGLLVTPDLKGLPANSVHGFHVHENASCDPAEVDGKMTPAGAAGGHFDPENAATHQGPYVEESHLGDLPVLIVDDQGNATKPVLAPRLKESNLAGHALMIHEGGDNYSDKPKLGGGGSRLACGVFSQQ
ncbi:superoxide dismutase family protein [Phytohalomonas tamaricis]|uniref:superoxide dismutase family protein n=1 Tax=Phytohalomonas tamaricis TaxID=2081032 RepID=UPI000D0B8E7E|nr:superoxide dismutase family protein [Phytohalomonas tamaricis]